MPDINIRDAEEQHVNLLTDLSRFVHDIHVEAHPAYFKPFELAVIAESFRSRLKDPNVRACIASVGDMPVGYVVIVLRERPEDARCLARRFYEIEELAVSALHRQRGVARALIEHVLREARSRGIHGVELTSWAFNATGRAAFEALGFLPMVVRFRRESDDLVR
jgi:ribosomal protein S18 acetylase RimI-like enzyme